MTPFDNVQSIVVISLILITFIGAWTMSMHFERAREGRRRLGEPARREKKRIDHELNVLRRVKNRVKDQLSLELVSEYLFTEGYNLQRSYVDVSFRGKLVCTIFCSADRKTLSVLDHVYRSSVSYGIDQISETVQYVLYGLRK